MRFTHVSFQEEEEYVEASFVFRTFEEEEFISPDEESDEE